VGRVGKPQLLGKSFVMRKVYADADEALAGKVKDGMTLN
jgi:hypothetical protein